MIVGSGVEPPMRHLLLLLLTACTAFNSTPPFPCCAVSDTGAGHPCGEAWDGHIAGETDSGEECEEN